MEISEVFLRELSKIPEAIIFFNKLNNTNKYSIAWGLDTAKKPKTHQKRMKLIIEMMKQEKKFN
ncbi:MAG: YdeI/OmpD-associated family protein [Melioribacteraceae bacterium]|nr:YdeI/OmpD-associated family protein [Melioribacteraceae bacterium]MCF8353695.1 YdeI/OmpD-associated family protein [Melioribacteraceae bacterium]MCF8396075.1 YdeI/OmpD-associated family protein [Melioribacteraceae bacterium]MCF8418611.1 YdeI/OmpD-associated family protein [Melioribacteraceae bacterium]